MKVLFVTREYPPFEVGGIAVHTFNLVKHLQKLGICCRVLSFGDPKYSNDEVTFIEPSSSVIRKSNSPAYMDIKIPLDILCMTRNANNLLKQEKFDVVHIEEPYVGAFVKHKRKVTTVHDTSYGEIKAIISQSPSFPNFKRVVFYVVLGFYFEFMCMASSSLVLIPAEQVKAELLRVYGVSKKKLRVVRNGVDISAVPSNKDKVNAKRQLGLDPEKPLIFTAAQHIPRKRLDTMIQAIKLLQDEGTKNYTIVIGGNGPIHTYLTDLSKKLGLNHVIRFSGWLSREKLTLYQRAADIFVLASEYEAGPISLLEAMSWRAAAVSSNIQGVPSLMRDGVDGLLFPVGNYFALGNCLKTLLTDVSLRNRLSNSARLFAEKFDWNEVAQETANIYKATL